MMGKGWKNPHKVAAAQKKGAIFTKLAREIQVATKMGGPDPASNPRLRLAIEAAKKQQCPNDTIDRAIKKGSGVLDDGSQIEELMYEGYGPHGTGVLVEAQTDNRNRTATQIRTIFKTHDGNMEGSVAWMFDRVCMIEGTKAGSFDPEEEAIEAGANEVEKNDDGSYTFYGDFQNMSEIQKALVGRGWTITTVEPSYKPKNITELTDAQMKDVVEFLNELDDHDDTHRVHVTIKS